MTDWKLNAADIEMLLDSISCMIVNLDKFPDYTFKKIIRLAQMADMLTDEFNAMNKKAEGGAPGLSEEDKRESGPGELFIFGKGNVKKGDTIR